MMRMKLLRDFEGGQNLDLFLIAAVSTVLAVRFYLHQAGFPTLGGGVLHIAHVLWGGMLMLAAIVLLLSFLNRQSRVIAALVGGIGFGLFIDETGKFLTHDNDYFFRPTAAVIYAVFILLYLGIRSLHREHHSSSEENLVNALKELEEVALRDLDREERRRALGYLDRSDAAHPLVPPLRAILLEAEVVGPSSGSVLNRVAGTVKSAYARLVSLPGFPTAVVVFFWVQLLLKFWQVLRVAFFLAGTRGPYDLPVFGGLMRPVEQLNFVDWGQIASTLLSGYLVARGTLAMRHHQLTAYRFFQKSVLVSLLITQVLMFYREQWSALGGLAVNVLLYVTLGYFIRREHGRGATGTTPSR